MQKRISKNDTIFIVLVIVFLAAVTLCYRLSGRAAGTEVLVTIDGKEYGTYSIEQEQEVSVQIDGKTTNVLTIKNGVVHMTWADCPDKLCVHQKEISKSKETIVCLPNKVVVQIIGMEESEFDSIAK